jgi:hypothetical protein
MMATIKRYTVPGVISFDVEAGENVDEKIEVIQRAYDNADIPPGNVYVALDPTAEPFLEDEHEQD